MLYMGIPPPEILAHHAACLGLTTLAFVEPPSLPCSAVFVTMTTILELGSLGTSLGQQNPSHAWISNSGLGLMTTSNLLGAALSFWFSTAFEGGNKLARSTISAAGVFGLMGLRQFFEMARWTAHKGGRSGK